MLLALVVLLSPYALSEIPQAVPPVDAKKLEQAGIHTTDDLLARAGAKVARKQIAKTTKVPEGHLRGYVELADFVRIRGVGPEMARLFGAAGVHSVRELAKADPKAFFDAVMAANQKQKITQNPPDAKSVASWIESAKTLPYVVE